MSVPTRDHGATESKYWFPNWARSMTPLRALLNSHFESASDDLLVRIGDALEGRLVAVVQSRPNGGMTP